MTQDIKALLRASKRAETTVPICLRMDLTAQFEALDRRLAEEVRAAAANPADTRLNNPTTLRASSTAEAMKELQQQMRDATVEFRLRALAPNRWAQLVDEHPPRKNPDGTIHEHDAIGCNAATFFPALLRRSIVSPELDDEAWALLMGEPADNSNEDDEPTGLTDGQFDKLAGAAWTINKSRVDIPFSPAASRLTQASGPA